MKKFFTASKHFKLSELASFVNAKLIGNPNITITSLDTLKSGKEGSLSFYNNHNYLKDLQTTSASACLIEEKDVERAKEGLNLLVVKNAYISFAMLGNLMYTNNYANNLIASNSVINKTAVLGKNVSIGNFSVIGSNVSIGNNVVIGNNVTIDDNVVIGDSSVILSNVTIKYAIIGQDCLIHEGVRIGQDGFGFAPNPSGHIKILQIGGVVIGNKVEIGANACIDRGALDNTEIGDGTKIDNMVQIAHNVKVGKHCFIAAMAGLAGSSIINDFVFVGGHVGIAPHVEVAAGKQIVPMSGVMNDIEGEPILMGTPAMGKRNYLKLQVLLNKLLKNKQLHALLKE